MHKCPFEFLKMHFTIEIYLYWEFNNNVITLMRFTLNAKSIFQRNHNGKSKWDKGSGEANESDSWK